MGLEDVEPGLADQVVPFRQRRGELRIVVGPRWDHAVETAGDGGGAAGAGDQEGGDAAFDDSLGHRRLAKPGHAFFERGDEFVAVLGLCG